MHFTLKIQTEAKSNKNLQKCNTFFAKISKCLGRGRLYLHFHEI